MKHKHYTEIVAWASGETIQTFDKVLLTWHDITIYIEPSWHPQIEYRIKPKETNLLPCPFCGGDLNNQDPMDTVYPSNRDKTLYQVVCNNCSATMLGESREEAITYWNTRKKES